MTSPNASVPKLPGGPDPDQPVPRTPVLGVDIATCAWVSAALAAGTEPRAAVLARARLTEATWTTVEQTWLLRIATATLQRDLSFTQAYDAAFAAAQAALPPPDPPMPLDAYAALVAQIEVGRAPAEVLAGAGLTLGAFMREQRAWTARMAADARLASSFRAKVAEAKRARP